MASDGHCHTDSIWQLYESITQQQLTTAARPGVLEQESQTLQHYIRTVVGKSGWRAPRIAIDGNERRPAGRNPVYGHWLQVYPLY
ncbi:MAG: hypothetical protein R3E89_18195 [Thiolinea sp.]